MKPNGRQVVAFIALADAPLPGIISLRDDSSVELTFSGPGATADMRIWMKLLGSDEGGARSNVSTNGQAWVSHHLWAGTIAGHPVVLWAHEPNGSGPDEPLDDATQGKLRQLVVDEVLAVPLAQLDAMKTARDEVFGEGGGPS